MTTLDRLVRVAVAAQADRPERTFSYRLGDELGAVAPGSLLLVPYGRRQALGYLLGAADTPPDAVVREVVAVVSEPLLSPALLSLAEEMATYYRAPTGEVLAAMLPPGLESRVVRRWSIGDEVETDAGSLDPEGLLDDRGFKRLSKRLGQREVDRLRRGGQLRPTWRLAAPRSAPQRSRTIVRHERAGIPRGSVQRLVLEALTVDVPETLATVADRLGRPAGALLEPARGLEAAGFVRLDWKTDVRDPLAHRELRPTLAGSLAAEQAEAVRAICDLPDGGQILIEGVAASGKTEVYLAAIADTLEHGQGAIVLVPELSLVPQLGDRLRAIFGDRVAALHSGLSAGERHDQWWRIRRGEADVVIGTRGAIFAPVGALGLVVIDEAHDSGYKNERSPRFDARWVAERLVAATGARLVLGSATPDLVTEQRVLEGSLARHRLFERRVGSAPVIEVIDLRAELDAGNRSVLSRALADALAAIEPGKDQAILFINRRGAATFVMCRDCGTAVLCPDCGLPFVHHLSGDSLRCHHCGRRAPVPSRCALCGSTRIRYFGAGTQRVEAEVRARFGELRIGRLDSDVLDRRRGFEAIYDDFRAGRLDVLVGTQLAAQGLDLPAVTLVAVVAADTTLHLPDFRAAERTFQLLAQVAGRAGRGPRPGRVLIQTYAPEHHAVQAAARLNGDAFARAELPRRRALHYPPYAVLARLLVADPDRARGESRATAAADAVRQADVDVQGPVPAWVPRRAGRWRWQIVIRAADPAARQAALERVPAGIGIDVDPESLL